jgi:serine/threonine-protein kinase
VVKKAAAKATGLEELCTLTAVSLEKEGDRKAFLARMFELTKRQVKDQPMPGLAQAPSTVASVAPAPSPELTPATIDRATRKLARHVGPLAGVLVKRAAQRAHDVRSLYSILAEHVEGERERERFLQDADAA